jgi:hypothetical protein
MRTALIVFFALCASGAANAEPVDVVKGLTRAFNLHDVSAMRTFWDENVTWFDVDGEKVTVAATGAKSMEEGMIRYFQSYPDARSRLSRIAENGAYVTAVETASWTGGGTKRQQSSVVVYEVRNEKVVRVWYYPAVMGKTGR